MVPREKLPEVVAEVDRLVQARAGALDAEEARAVLAEVGLPGELLEDALAQIRVRDAARAARRRRLGIVGAIVWVVLAVGVTVLVVRTRAVRAREAIGIASAEIFDERAGGKVVTTARREDTPPLRLDAELTNVPRSGAVPLACDWIAPSGAIAHHNAWKTKTVEHAPWRTHCRYALPSTAELGRWHVHLTLEGRDLATRDVLVE